MRRALPIILLFLTPWMLAWSIPSDADKYIGWSDWQLTLLTESLAAINLLSMPIGLMLFEKRPPPLYWPRAVTWWIAFLHAIILIGTSIWDHQLINVTVFFAGLTLWYLFLSENMRFWNARPCQA